MQNPYDLLGVRPDDDAETIKSAFRKAAKASHPDHHGGDLQAAARFRQISLAYEILSDVQQRAAYDQLLEAQLRPSVELRDTSARLFKSELGPSHHELKRSWSDIRRPVVQGMTTGVLLAVVLVVGCNLYDRVLKMPSDETAGVMARQSASAAARTAEDDESEHVAAPQIPMVPLAMPAAREGAASAANDHDKEENANIEPASNPTAQPIAVASQGSKSDIHAGAGVTAQTEGGPHVPHGAPSRGAPSTKMPARAAATRDTPSRQLLTPAAPATPFEEFARQQERRNAAAVEEFKRLRWCETGYC